MFRVSNYFSGKAPAAVIALAFAVSSCSSASTASSSTSTTQPVLRSAMTIGQTAQLAGNFNPYDLAPSNFVMMYQLYSTLILESSTLKPEPNLASSWKLATDGLSMTLNLRPAKFSNGDPITSQTVAYDINLVKQKVNGANIRVLANNVTSVATPSPSTVVLKFAKPFPGIYDLLNLLFITDPATVNSKYLTVDASGPFEVSQYTPGVGFSMVPNPHYWGLPAKLKIINVKFLPSEQTMIDALRTSTIDFADLISPFDAKVLKGSSNFVTGVPPLGNSAFAISLNTASSPLNNIDVRQALSLALDRQRMVAVALDGFGTPACLPFVAPTQLGYDKQLASSCKFDLTAAKAKLQQSGLPSAALSFTLVTSTQASPILTQMAEIFQADLAQIGVTMKIQNLSSAAWNAASITGNFQALAQPYGRANLDPSTLFTADTLWYPTGNNSHFNNSEYTSLVEKADSSYDPAVRANLYSQIDKIILQQNFALPIADNPRPYATSSSVHGLVWSVNGQPILSGVTVG